MRSCAGRPPSTQSGDIAQLSGIRAILIKLAERTSHDDRELPRTAWGFWPGMTHRELYDSVRAWWVLDRERVERYPYAVAVHRGVIRGVWEIDHTSWRHWDNAPGRARRRWAFEGRPAPPDVQVALIGRRIPTTRPNGKPLFGSGSPIAYWPE